MSGCGVPWLAYQGVVFGSKLRSNPDTGQFQNSPLTLHPLMIGCIFRMPGQSFQVTRLWPGRDAHHGTSDKGYCLVCTRITAGVHLVEQTRLELVFTCEARYPTIGSLPHEWCPWKESNLPASMWGVTYFRRSTLTSVTQVPHVLYHVSYKGMMYSLSKIEGLPQLPRPVHERLTSCVYLSTPKR